jgi:hypothetical protein
MGNEQLPHQEDYFRRRMSYEFGVTGPEHEADLLEGLCEGFVRANQIQIRAEPDSYPCCLGCGSYIYVEPENCRVYDWKTRRHLKTDGNCQHVFGAYPLDVRRKGTCIDLACMLCAIYREKDNDREARVIIEHQVDGNGDGIPGKYHAMVMRGDGRIVDPTEKVKQATAAASAAAIQVGKACDC